MSIDLRDQRADRADQTADRAMCVLLLPRPEIGPIFYHEPRLDEGGESGEPDADEAPITSARGLRARLRRTGDGVLDIERRAPAWLRSPIRWLRSKLPADERLVLSLRSAVVVELYHPTDLPGDEARGAWSRYVDRSFRRRLVLFVAYLLVLVPATMLTIVPGPNVVGIWVAFRLVAHGLALIGLSRCRRGRVAVEPRASSALDGPVVTDKRATDRVQRAFRLRGLMRRVKRDRVLARLSVRRRRAEASP